MVVHAEPAVRMDAPGDVAQREFRSGDVVVTAQSGVDQAPGAGGFLDRRRDRRQVPLVRRGAHQTPEYPAHRPVEHRLLGVHPAVDAGAGVRVRRPERRAGGVHLREIAQDRVALPEGEIALLQRRHQPGRVHRAVFGRVGLAERAADIDPLERQPEFAQAPENLHHVAGRVAAPHDALHGFSPPDSVFAG